MEKNGMMKKIHNIIASIGQKEYLFTNHDYNNLCNNINFSISDKHKLPKKIRDHQSRRQYEKFFRLIRTKRIPQINSLISNFLQDTAICLENSKKNDNSEESYFEEDYEQNKNYQQYDSRKNLENLQGQKQKQNGSNFVKANEFSQNQINFNKLIDSKESQQDKTNVSSEKKQFTKKMKNKNNNYLIDLTKEFCEIDDDENNIIDQNKPAFINQNDKYINNNEFVQNDNIQTIQKDNSLTFQNLVFNQLHIFYNESNKNEKIFFQIFQEEDKYKNMLEKIVSNFGMEDKDNYQCTMCLQLPLIPIKCSNCNMMVCIKCAFEWKQKKDECPHGCKGSWKLQKPCESELNNIVLNQYFYCEYKKFGCASTNNIQDIFNHEKNCQYKAIPCQFCKNLVIKQDMDIHELQCESRVCKCKQCTFTFIARDKNTHNCIKTVLSHYSQIKQEFKQYQLDIEEKFNKLESQLSDALEHNKNCQKQHSLEQNKDIHQTLQNKQKDSKQPSQLLSQIKNLSENNTHSKPQNNNAIQSQSRSNMNNQNNFMNINNNNINKQLIILQSQSASNQQIQVNKNDQQKIYSNQHSNSQNIFSNSNSSYNSQQQLQNYFQISSQSNSNNNNHPHPPFQTNRQNLQNDFNEVQSYHKTIYNPPIHPQNNHQRLMNLNNPQNQVSEKLYPHIIQNNQKPLFNYNENNTLNEKAKIINNKLYEQNVPIEKVSNFKFDKNLPSIFNNNQIMFQNNNNNYNIFK